MNGNETAYELADRIEKNKGMPYTVKMLRQLQAENEALKERISYLESQVYGGTTK